MNRLERVKETVRIPILHRYLLRHFFSVFFVCLGAATSLFLIVDLFDRMRTFVRESADLLDVFLYLMYKIPLIIHLMTPVAVLIAVLLSVGRLSQLSEVTAMRACGARVWWICTPLLGAGLVIAGLMYLAGETIVPLATQRTEEIWSLDIKKRLEKGRLSRAHFWFRDHNRFYQVGLFESRLSNLHDISMFEVDSEFRVSRRLEAPIASWSKSPLVGWSFTNAEELFLSRDSDAYMLTSPRLPLVVDETPVDFSTLKRRPETMNSEQLRRFIEDRARDNLPTTEHEVQLAAKKSFPFVTALVVLVALPFALVPARSGSLALSFVAGAALGFGYHVVHAFSVALGNSELIPIWAAAWNANILCLLGGIYLVTWAEHR